MKNGVTFRVNLDEYLLRALKEDITSEDVTTNAVMPVEKQGKADLICKEDGILCGISVFCRVFELLDNTFTFSTTYKDGDFIKEIVVENEQPTGTINLDKTIAIREDVDTSLVDISDLSGYELNNLGKNRNKILEKYRKTKALSI